MRDDLGTQDFHVCSLTFSMWGAVILRGDLMLLVVGVTSVSWFKAGNIGSDAV